MGVEERKVMAAVSSRSSAADFAFFPSVEASGGEGEGGWEKEMWQMLRGEREAEGGHGSPSSPCEVERGTRGREGYGYGEGKTEWEAPIGVRGEMKNEGGAAEL